MRPHLGDGMAGARLRLFVINLQKDESHSFPVRNLFKRFFDEIVNELKISYSQSNSISLQ